MPEDFLIYNLIRCVNHFELLAARSRGPGTASPQVSSGDCFQAKTGPRVWGKCKQRCCQVDPTSSISHYLPPPSFVNSLPTTIISVFLSPVQSIYQPFSSSGGGQLTVGRALQSLFTLFFSPFILRYLKLDDCWRLSKLVLYCAMKIQKTYSNRNIY